MPRFFCPAALSLDATLELPPAAARHVQVLRQQPGDAITLFNGQGGQWRARILRMGRSDVAVQVEAFEATEREPLRAVHLVVGMPANERMDWLVEKATELGVASIQPVQTAHSVLRLSGDRASKKQQHWQAVAVAACEQCGGNRVPVVHPVSPLADGLQAPPSDPAQPVGRLVLSLAPGSRPLREAIARTELADPAVPIWVLSGPEGGLAPAEDAAARSAGWAPVGLGPRVLRAETAALTALVQCLD